MATTTVTCYNDKCYRNNNILALRDTEMLVGADYSGDNYREYFGMMQFSLPALYDQNITSAKLFLYVKETKLRVELEPQFYNIKEKVTINTHSSWESMYSDKFVLSGPETRIFDSSSTIFNSWISLDVTNLVTGNNSNETFTLVLADVKHDQWSTGAGGTSVPYVCRIATIEGGYAPYIVITHENAKPFRPTILYPDGDIVPNYGSVTFRWKYNAGISAGQAKYEFGWKMQSNSDWNTVTVTSSEPQHTISNAAIFVNGIAEWRVKTYNNVGMSSEYATGQFYVQGRPSNPIITDIKNDALTEIAWAAEKSEESSARIKILKDGKEIYDSGVVSGGIEDVHRPNIILQNGVYATVLQIANIYDLWSDPIAKSFTINRTRPEKPQLSVISCGDYVQLNIKGTINSFYIYRSESAKDEFVPIAYINPPFNNEGYIYKDFSVKSDVLYKYFVRAYYEGGISDSNTVDVYVKYDGYYLSEISDMSNRINFKLSEDDIYITVTSTENNENVYMQYLGRRYPIKEASAFSRKTININSFLYNNQKNRMDEIFLKNGLYCFRSKDVLFYGDITSYNTNNTLLNLGYSVSLVLEKMDYKEVIDYV